jgi:C4-type Zn-finger protein
MSETADLKPIKLYSSFCPVCGTTIDMYLHTYRTPLGEFLAILTAKCEKCGFKSSSVLTIEAGTTYNCIKLNVEHSEDLNTLIYLGEDVVITIPTMDIHISSSQLSIGSIVTAEALLLYIIESLKDFCTARLDNYKCKMLLELEKQINLGKIEEKIEIILKSSEGVSVLKSYREGNFELCQ